MRAISVIDIDGTFYEKFVDVPRIGDFVSIRIKGLEQVRKVTAVVWSSDSVCGGFPVVEIHTGDIP